MRVHRLVMPAIVIVVLLGTVQIASALGLWQTSGQALVDMDNFMPEHIRDWMSLELIAEGAGIPLETLYQVFGLPEDTLPGTAMKDLEGIVEVSTARILLADYLGVSLSGHDDEPAASEPAATPTPTQQANIEPTATHVPGEDGGTGGGPTPVSAGQLSPADIEGRMTLREVSAGTGIPLDALLEAAGLPANTSPNLALKDLVSQIDGFEVQIIRDAVAQLLSQ